MFIDSEGLNVVIPDKLVKYSKVLANKIKYRSTMTKDVGRLSIPGWHLFPLLIIASGNFAPLYFADHVFHPHFWNFIAYVDEWFYGEKKNRLLEHFAWRYVRTKSKNCNYDLGSLNDGNNGTEAFDSLKENVKKLYLEKLKELLPWTFFKKLWREKNDDVNELFYFDSEFKEGEIRKVSLRSREGLQKYCMAFMEDFPELYVDTWRGYCKSGYCVNENFQKLRKEFPDLFPTELFPKNSFYR